MINLKPEYGKALSIEKNNVFVTIHAITTRKLNGKHEKLFII